MKIYVVGSNKNIFLPLDDIREKFIINETHKGDNIDDLNPWYCELTGLYYLWKNCDDDIVGLEHYRRYFVNNQNKLLSKTFTNYARKEKTRRQRNGAYPVLPKCTEEPKEHIRQLQLSEL